MNCYVRSLATASIIVLTLGSTPGIAQMQPREPLAPNVPSAIQVPPGNTAFLKGHAKGTQNYMWIGAGSGYSWKFMGPQATLFLAYKWMGDDLLMPATFLQRIATAGGVMPSVSCTVTNAGEMVFVPYTADYLFYKASGNNEAAGLRAGLFI